MPRVEVFEDSDDNSPIFVGEFDFLPSLDETISKDSGGFLTYYTVKEVWHRELGSSGKFQPCLKVARDD